MIAAPGDAAALVDLYGRQPNLNTRTSTSIRDQAYSTQNADGQWSDEEYAEARRRAGRPDYAADDAQPSYPGGPVEGDYVSDGGYEGS